MIKVITTAQFVVFLKIRFSYQNDLALPMSTMLPKYKELVYCLLLHLLYSNYIYLRKLTYVITVVPKRIIFFHIFLSFI